MLFNTRRWLRLTIAAVFAFGLLWVGGLSPASTPVARAASCWVSNPNVGSNPASDDMYLSGSYVKTPSITVSCNAAVSWLRVYGYLKYNGNNVKTPDVTCTPQNTGRPVYSCTMPATSAYTSTRLSGWSWNYYYNWTN